MKEATHEEGTEGMDLGGCDEAHVMGAEDREGGEVRLCLGREEKISL